MNKYRTNNTSSKNPFDEEPDDFDFKFGNRNNSKINDTFGTRDEEDNLKQIQERIGRSENESLESTRRALQCLNETHEIGVKTAAELVSQGEKLQRIDERLDEVDQTLTSTQKNINSLKSIFGNLFNRSSKQPAAKPKNQMTPSNSFNNNNNAAAAKIIEEPRKGEFSVITGSDREQEMNKNLDEMSIGLSRLTSLAKEMSFELDRQNPMIDRIGSKVDNSHTKINYQNDQMKKILKN
jgi:hypothetical protein